MPELIDVFAQQDVFGIVLVLTSMVR